MIKMIVTDLDGTLLNRHKQLSPKNRDALIAAQHQGIKVVLATGRNFHSLGEIITQLEMDKLNDSYVIGTNGIQLYDFGLQELDENPGIPSHEVARIQDLLNRHNCVAFYFGNDGVVCKYNKLMVPLFKLRPIRKIINHYIAASNKLRVEFQGAASRLTDEQHKICFIVFNPRKLTAVIAAVGPGYQVFKVGTKWIEIVPLNTSKGQRLREIMTKEGLDGTQIAVFGDGENDLDMLELGPNSYAVANAMDQVKARAARIIESNDQDGVGREVERLLENNRRQGLE